MPSGEAADAQSVILGGCSITGDDPQLGCDACGWRGLPGGRTYKTVEWKPKYKPGTEEWEQPEVIQVAFDVVKADLETLWRWAAEGYFEARLELLHRGVPLTALQAEEAENPDWDPMPIEAMEEVAVYVNPETWELKGAFYFYAHEKACTARYRLASMDGWEFFEDSNQLRELARTCQEPGIAKYTFKITDDQAEGIMYGDSTWFGHVGLENMKDGRVNMLVEMKEGETLEVEGFYVIPLWFDIREYFRSIRSF